MSNKDEIRIRFESSAKYQYEKCDVACDTPYIERVYTTLI
jgi:hypothetical protein